MAVKKKLANFISKLRPVAIKYGAKIILRALGLKVGGAWLWFADVILGAVWDYALVPFVKWVDRKRKKARDRRRADDLQDASSESDVDDAIDRMP